MITTRNRQQNDGEIHFIKDRAAHLVQALEKCPLEFTVEALAIFDKFNSRGANSPSAKRWIRQFCGFEGGSKAMEPIIEVLNDRRLVEDKETLKGLMMDMKDVA